MQRIGQDVYSQNGASAEQTHKARPLKAIPAPLKASTEKYNSCECVEVVALAKPG